MRDALRLLARGEDPARAAAASAPPGCGAAAVTSTLETLRARQRGMDPPLASLLDDPAVTDVLINGTQAWVDRGGGLVRVDAGIRDEADARRAAIRLASASGVRLDDARPIADGTLPGGVRLHAVLAPVSGSGTLISLRVLGTRRLGISDLAACGTLPGAVGTLPLRCSGLVRAHHNHRRRPEQTPTKASVWTTVRSLWRPPVLLCPTRTPHVDNHVTISYDR